MRGFPAHPVPRVPHGEDPAAALAHAPRHPLSDVGGAAIEPADTRVALLHDDERLHVSFECASEPPLTLRARQHQDPVFLDECVELFLAEPADPARYFELVVSPAGLFYAARVFNPDGSRETWQPEARVAPAGLTLDVTGEPAGPPEGWRRWRCTLSLPWTTLSEGGRPPAPGETRRGNLYRIARGRTTRFEALSPTLRSTPPDFHVPSRFAAFVFEGASS